MLWYILIGIVALVWLLLLIPLSLTVVVDEDGNRRTYGRVMGIIVYRSPKKERPVRLSDYSPRALKRKQKKEQRARIKEMRKQRKKSVAPKKTTSDEKPSLIEQISLIGKLAQTVLRRSLYHARVDVERLAITVASSDAAKTALLYGATCSDPERRSL